MLLGDFFYIVFARFAGKVLINERRASGYIMVDDFIHENVLLGVLPPLGTRRDAQSVVGVEEGEVGTGRRLQGVRVPRGAIFFVCRRHVVEEDRARHEPFALDPF